MALSQIEEVYFQAWGKAGGSGRICQPFLASKSGDRQEIDDQDRFPRGRKDSREAEPKRSGKRSLRARWHLWSARTREGPQLA